MLKINIVTIFPEFFTTPLSLSIPAKAVAAGQVEYHVVDLRAFTHDRHRTVDDYPYGGGPGMVMKPGPFFEAVEALGARAPIALMSPRGRRFTHADAVRFSEGTELTLLCGHYKDVDHRVAEHLATEELSLGDFVLSGGEPAALAIVDATVRLLPGAMSDLESARTDSFYDRGISAPSYTRPPEYRGHAVPPVLVAGDHGKTAQWREQESRRLTIERARREVDELSRFQQSAADYARANAEDAEREARREAERARRKRARARRRAASESESDEAKGTTSDAIEKNDANDA
jgi:tRNA (guanine37-N1)-methyltransferase